MTSDGFLQHLAGAEGNLLGGLDLDRLAGLRVAAHAGGALADLQDAEVADADALALLQRLGDRREELVEQRSEEHTSELQSLMRISYAVFCLKKKNQTKQRTAIIHIIHLKMSHHQN